MIAGANYEGHWVSLNGQNVGGSYISAAHGSTTAGPMWGDAMKAISAWLPDVDFTPPSGQDIAGVLTEVPDTGGMSVEQATSLLESLGFVVEIGGFRASGYAYGTVAYTLPGRGTDLASATTITIYQSTGHAPPKPPRGGGGGGGDGNGNGNGHGHGHDHDDD
jgi:hypothetical protein